MYCLINPVFFFQKSVWSCSIRCRRDSMKIECNWEIYIFVSFVALKITETTENSHQIKTLTALWLSQIYSLKHKRGASQSFTWCCKCVSFWIFLFIFYSNVSFIYIIDVGRWWAVCLILFPSLFWGLNKFGHFQSIFSIYFFIVFFDWI